MVSIIIPTYNNKTYIGESIESLLNQTYKDIEIIVVDDGSTDGTDKFLNKYKGKIVYIKKTNGGEASARNKGLDVAKGEYIAFLDSDDLYTEDKIEKQLEQFIKFKDIDVIYNNVDVVDEKLNYIKTLRSEGIYKNQHNFLCMMLVRQIIPGTASIMFKRKCVKDKKVRYSEKYTNSVDYYFTIQLASRYKFKYIDRSLYTYRRHEKNLTNNHKNQLKCEIDIIKDLGMKRIEGIVEKSTFKEDEKKLILAKILMKIGEWSKAKKLLNSLLIEHNNRDIFFCLGNCNYMLKKYEDALECYNRAIILDSNMAELYNNRGCIYLELDNKCKAKYNFKNALELRDEYIDAKYNLHIIDNFKDKKYKLKLTTKELRKVLTNY